MTEQHSRHREHYQEARRKFDDLRIEDKAIFLLESTVTTLARGLEEVGRVIADSLEKTFESAERRRSDDAAPEGDAMNGNDSGRGATGPDDAAPNVP